MILTIVVVSVSLLLMAPAAQAYIDPGTSGMLLQVIGAAVVGLAVAGRKYLGAIGRKLFTGSRRDRQDGGQDKA